MDLKGRIRNVMDNSPFNARDIAILADRKSDFVTRYLEGFPVRRPEQLSPILALIEAGHVVKVRVGVYHIHDQPVTEPLP